MPALTLVDVLTEPFSGYQQASAYRFRREEAEKGEPVEMMVPRALMIRVRSSRSVCETTSGVP